MKADYDYWYVYTHDLQGRSTYERTVNTEEQAKERIKELQKQGKQATYHIDIIKGAYY